MPRAMRDGAQDITNVGDALEGLVHQFADPWAFLRELVQNAVDVMRSLKRTLDPRNLMNPGKVL